MKPTPIRLKTTNPLPAQSTNASSTSLSSKHKLAKYFNVTFVLFIVSFIVQSLFATPEGNIREGDYLPLILVFMLFTTSLLLFTYRIYKSLSSQSLTNKKLPPKLNEKTSRLPSKAILADVSLACFIFFITLSYLRIVLFHLGDVRLSTNAYWTIVTPALFYYLLRLYRTHISSSIIVSILAIIFTCGIAESTYSIYSYMIINPQLRESYRQNPDQVLKEANLNYKPNSKERLLFEKRLLDSSEPTGSYGLANTLAGFLIPSLLLGVLVTSSSLFGCFPTLKNNSHLLNELIKKNSKIVFIIMVTFLQLFVLLLTKSRSGILATTIGSLGLLAFFCFFFKRKKHSLTKTHISIGFTLITCIVLVFIGAFSSGIIDREVISEASKSLGYRLDYWKSTIAIIKDYPVLGIGPGEFQNVYARYILPTASEFIADPHNFLFEIAALFGIPATLAFCVFFIIVLVSIFRIKSQYFDNSDQQSSKTNTKSNNSYQNKSTKTIVPVMGAYLGLFLLFLCSFFQETPLDIRFLFNSSVVFLLIPSICATFSRITKLFNERTGYIIISIIILSIFLNLCVAGGISYPVLSVSLFFMAAICVNHSLNDELQESSEIVVHRYQSNIIMICLLFSLTLLCVFYHTAFAPRCRSFLFSLHHSSINNLSSYQRQNEIRDQDYKKIDKYSISVAEQFYYYSGLEFSKSPVQSNQERWLELANNIRKISPNSATVRERCGDFDWAIYSQNISANKQFLDSSLAFYQEAVSFSPTDVCKRTKLFYAYQAKGLTEKAIVEAQKAIELDQITNHEDRKLSAHDRNELLLFLKKIRLTQMQTN